MGRTREFDVEEAISTATELFWRGYGITSLAELTNALGIAPASLYHAFGSKEALFRQIVERYIAFHAEAFGRAFEARGPVEGVRALLRGYAEVVTDPAHARGCLVVNSAPSNDADDALRQWLAGHREALRSRLESRFASELARGTLPQGSDPQVMARFVVTLAGGLSIEAQAGAGRQELYAMIDFAMRSFACDDGA